jgi:hypothetical protein
VLTGQWRPRSTPGTGGPGGPTGTSRLMSRAALKCLCLVSRSLDPTGRGRARWVTKWKPALNSFAITFEGRLVPSTTN